jgi:hypothetical protein
MNPFEQLLSQPSGSNVPPETLEMLGRQASQLFQTQGVPLNQAVSQVLSNHPELGNEHVKRIIEFANTVTFQEMFQNSEDKNVHFDVADPGVVLRDLKDGGSSSHSGRTLNTDYQRPPQPQQSGSNSDVDAALMQQFTGSSTPINEATKVASVTEVDHEKHANPIEDAYDAMIRLQATREKLAESHEHMDLMLAATHEDFYRQVREQVADPEGSGLGGVLGALEKVASQELLEVVMAPVAERLVKEGYNQQYLTQSMRKTAGAVPNLDHPLFSSFDAILKLANEMVICDRAISDVDKMLEDIKVPFKKIAGALTTEVKKTVGHHGHVPAGIRQRFPRD